MSNRESSGIWSVTLLLAGLASLQVNAVENSGKGVGKNIDLGMPKVSETGLTKRESSPTLSNRTGKLSSIDAGVGPVLIDG